jgi:nicotinamidase-related amidase
MRHADGLDIPTTLSELLDPAIAALLVYDMQVGIVNQIADGPAIVARVREVLHAARTGDVRVFFTRHLSLPTRLMGIMQYRTAMAWQGVDDPAAVKPWFLRDSPGFPIVPELTPTAEEAVFDKITMSAFEGTPLAIALRDCGIRVVVLVGIALEIGIEPTARHAADLGIVPVVVRDGCGHGQVEAAARTIDQLSFLGDAQITDAATVIERWRG